ncbi:MAG: hypothetical protein ACRDNT_06550 [Streptosporangiaceae bacterium]
MPGDIDKVHGRLAGPWDEQGPVGQGVYRPACLVPGDVEAGYADSVVLGDAEGA